MCKKSRCVKSAADKKKGTKAAKAAKGTKGTKRAKRSTVKSPTVSQAMDAVMAVAPRRVAKSLAAKGYSKTAGAGVATLVMDTKKEYKRMARGKKSAAGKPGTGCTRERVAACRAKGMVCKKDASGAARCQVSAADKKSGKKAVMKAFMKGPKASTKCTDPCTATRKGAPRVREHKTCKCLASGGDALRKKGVCTPRRGRDGKMYETVFAGGRCLKAGGAAAKAALPGSAACPVGKVLKRYTTQVPLVDPYSGQVLEMRRVPATRCVKAVGDLKDCPKGKVLVSVPSSGTTPGGVGWRKDVARCMLRQTAMKKGYNFIAGGLRVPGYTPAQSIGV